MNETTLAETPDSALAACAAGVPAIGYGEDVYEAGAECALVSTIWNWGVYYTGAVEEVLAGKWKGVKGAVPE